MPKHLVAILSFIGALSLLGILLLAVHSWYIYSVVDPRILPAKTLQLRLHKQVGEEQLELALFLLGEIEAIYRGAPGYESSHELGVLENNKASVYLVHIETLLLEGQIKERGQFNEMLRHAEKHLQKAMAIYSRWEKDFGDLSKGELYALFRPFYDKNAGLNGCSTRKRQRLLEDRVVEVRQAQQEIDRRVSVCLTNLGMVDRYYGKLDAAKARYERALRLWPYNRTARNNLNSLLSLPLEKRSILDSLFPPSRNVDEISTSHR